MKYLLLTLFLVSCASLPDGSKVMSQKVQEDKNENNKAKSLKASEKFDEYLTIYAHPQEIDGGLFMRGGIFLLPVKEELKSWDEVMKEDF
jgi:hypothetical protein